METDYRTLNADIGVSGSYTGPNKTFGSLVQILPTDNRVQSGKIHNLSLLFSGSTFQGNVDVVFHSSQSYVSPVGRTYTSSFSDLKSILSCVSFVGTSSLGTDFSQCGDHMVASLHNLNIPFNSDALFVSTIFQHTGTQTFQSGSVWMNVGYELGESR
mgnify:CR=1 FL=1